ncbi:VWA domain-containing protein [Adhaeribacter radiodurans]|uniref:VWA domain-containing protein n=1 Tax=Adhaeribacter radiodurans TaxID=2745197 RepID=A0A7L7L7E2_9BACT|nr:VWA domain-containing protein [Adhaeribacter radiodurans]QMU28717.1 VWA domain-containing protein [Adhaeribacter radiodurans]
MELFHTPINNGTRKILLERTIFYFKNLFSRTLLPSYLIRILILIISFYTYTQEAFAGDGRIAVAPTNSFGIRGVMDFSVNFRYIPAPADITRVRTAIENASDIICDATDGQIVFGTVTITAGGTNDDRADVWILPQGGRSGVSFFFNGSGFGNLGSHIDLYQGGIDGGVLAHELGHLAFGLGDEYDEQCRFGGPCGIGQAFDPGTIDARNNTLMQQSGIDQTEFTVAANHDLLRGDGTNCVTNNCGGTAMDCSTCQGFNGNTNRFESSQHTLIHGGNSEWQIIANNYPALGIVIPALPVAARPVNCRAFLNIVNTVNASDLVCLVIDRSGSMTANDAGGATRMEFAKAAARAFVDVSLGLGNNYQLGLVSFSDAATVHQPVQLLTTAYAATLKSSIDGISAGGNTAIGDGLLAGAFEMVGKKGANPTLFLLSDGQNNRGTNPESVIPVLRSRGIRTFTIPVGNGADRPLLSNIAGTTGGRMLDAPTADELPPIYMELAAIHSGNSLVLPRKEFSLFGQIIIGAPKGADTPKGALVEFENYPINVEADAQGLVVFISNRNPDIQNWFPTFTITGPDGSVITPQNQPFIGTDTYYQIIRIPKPAPGSWNIKLESASGRATFGHVLAFVENPSPDLHVDAFPKVASESDTITLSAMASYVAEIDEGVEYSGFIMRPDSSTAPLHFTRDPYTRKVSASFADYNGRGIYQATIQAVVSGGAKLFQGERIFAGKADPGINVPYFTRTATASFFLNTPSFPPSGSNDPDKDGIPTDVEDKFPDVDNDDIPCYLDEDSDNDDIPDSVEADKDLNQNGILDFVEPKDPSTCPGGQSSLKLGKISVQRPTCGNANGKIQVTVSGGAGPYTYKWSHLTDLDAASASKLPDGIYSVIITDAKGCSVSSVFNLLQDCSKNVVVQNNCPDKVVQGCKWNFRLKVDMRKSAAPHNLLGSFTGKLTWDPAQLEALGTAQLLNKYKGFVRLDKAAGTLSFNGANSTGMAGVVDILNSNFITKAKAGEKISLKAEFSVMAAAKTYANLTSKLLIQICEPTVSKGGGILGDVNTDDAVNSTDGLIVLSYDAGKSVPKGAKTRIDQGFGDVNLDKKTNSADGLIILDYELRGTSKFPVGTPFCPADAKADSRLAQTNNKGKVMITANGSVNKQDASWIEVPVIVNMTPTQEELGSFTTTIKWNTAALELLSFNGGQSQGFEDPIVNTDELKAGKLTIVNANPAGGKGAVHIFTLHFKKQSLLSEKDFTLDFSSLASAHNFSDLTANIQTQVSLTDEALDNDFEVAPNPFNHSTIVQYKVKTATQVDISVYNSVGEKVATLVKEKVKAGTHSYNWNTSTGNLMPGMYIIKMQAGKITQTRKVIYYK